MMRLTLLIVLTGLLAACLPTSVVLTPSAARLAMLAAPDAGCAAVGLVSTQAGPNWQGWDDNVALAQDQLRNRSAELGADSIIFHSPVNFTIDDTGCPGCVAMSATALRCQPAR